MALAITLLASGTVFGLPLRAQQLATISGKVTDAKTGEPISAAAITVQGSQLGGVSGDDGAYRVARVPAGSHTITARRLGYAPGTKTVTVEAGSAQTLDF
ncbi:MAG: carboxypeptidase-like regulatory domain-containing protein, partial [Gemmatimonadaceae bacterium]